MMGRRGLVRLSGVRVGLLEERNGQTQFTYDEQWLRRQDAVPISLTLPLTARPYTNRGLHPFFSNLLPEGWLLDVVATKLNKSKDDAVGLLLATCADCIGAVEILPADEIGPISTES
jgi:HipA-like protein